MEMAENYDKDFACRIARIGEQISDIEEEAYGEEGGIWNTHTLLPRCQQELQTKT